MLVGELQLSQSWRQSTSLIESFIKQNAIAGRPLRILEAGCGKRWSLNLGDIEFALTGVDIDSAALEKRKNVDLCEAIVGDLRSVTLKENYFDVIYCSYVLEHVQGAEEVLRNFVKWLRPNGIIILKIPDPHSVSGYITRKTPHAFHKFYYRYILGDRNAGKPDYAPYRTFYDPIVSRRGIRDFCREMSLAIDAEYGDGYKRHGKGVVRFALRLVTRSVSALSFGRLSGDHANLLYVIRKERA